MRQDIKGFGNHPDLFQLRDYAMEAPEGKWTGRLDYQAWGKSLNLFCYFTEVASGKKIRLSVFHEKQYHPAQEGPAFDEEPVGGTFEITTEKSKKGLPKFVAARKLP